MRDIEKASFPDYPNRQVSRSEYLKVTHDQYYTQAFVWLNGGPHNATVSYDINGMAIGFEDNGICFIFD